MTAYSLSPLFWRLLPLVLIPVCVYIGIGIGIEIERRRWEATIAEEARRKARLDEHDASLALPKYLRPSREDFTKSFVHINPPPMTRAPYGVRNWPHLSDEEMS